VSRFELGANSEPPLACDSIWNVDFSRCSLRAIISCAMCALKLTGSVAWGTAEVYSGRRVRLMVKPQEGPVVFFLHYIVPHRLAVALYLYNTRAPA
jgi:hypothetical protein